MWSLFRKPERFSAGHLQHVQSVIRRHVDGAAAASHAEETLITTLKELGELMVYGDKHADKFFDFFCEKRIMTDLCSILRSPAHSNATKTQVIQTIMILLQNLENERSLHYLLSNNQINDMIDGACEACRKDEELLAYTISFMRAISINLNRERIHFFLVDRPTPRFPLYTRALEFFDQQESMVRIAARTITLNIYRVDYPGVDAFVAGDPHSRFPVHVAIQVARLAEAVQALIRQVAGFIPPPSSPVSVPEAAAVPPTARSLHEHSSSSSSSSSSAAAEAVNGSVPSSTAATPARGRSKRSVSGVTPTTHGGEWSGESPGRIVMLRCQELLSELADLLFYAGDVTGARAERLAMLLSNALWAELVQGLLLPAVARAAESVTARNFRRERLRRHQRRLSRKLAATARVAGAPESDALRGEGSLEASRADMVAPAHGKVEAIPADDSENDDEDADGDEDLSNGFDAGGDEDEEEEEEDALSEAAAWRRRTLSSPLALQLLSLLWRALPPNSRMLQRLMGAMLGDAPDHLLADGDPTPLLLPPWHAGALRGGDGVELPALAGILGLLDDAISNAERLTTAATAAPHTWSSVTHLDLSIAATLAVVWSAGASAAATTAPGRLRGAGLLAPPDEDEVDETSGLVRSLVEEPFRKRSGASDIPSSPWMRSTPRGSVAAPPTTGAAESSNRRLIAGLAFRALCITAPPLRPATQRLAREILATCGALPVDAADAGGLAPTPSMTSASSVSTPVATPSAADAPTAVSPSRVTSRARGDTESVVISSTPASDSAAGSESGDAAAGPSSLVATTATGGGLTLRPLLPIRAQHRLRAALRRSGGVLRAVLDAAVASAASEDSDDRSSGESSPITARPRPLTIALRTVMCAMEQAATNHTGGNSLYTSAVTPSTAGSPPPPPLPLSMVANRCRPSAPPSAMLERLSLCNPVLTELCDEMDRAKGVVDPLWPQRVEDADVDARPGPELAYCAALEALRLRWLWFQSHLPAMPDERLPVLCLPRRGIRVGMSFTASRFFYAPCVHAPASPGSARLLAAASRSSPALGPSSPAPTVKAGATALPLTPRGRIPLQPSVVVVGASFLVLTKPGGPTDASPFASITPSALTRALSRAGASNGELAALWSRMALPASGQATALSVAPLHMCSASLSADSPAVVEVTIVSCSRITMAQYCGPAALATARRVTRRAVPAGDKDIDASQHDDDSDSDDGGEDEPHVDDDEDEDSGADNTADEDTTATAVAQPPLLPGSSDSRAPGVWRYWLRLASAEAALELVSRVSEGAGQAMERRVRAWSTADWLSPANSGSSSSGAGTNQSQPVTTTTMTTTTVTMVTNSAASSHELGDTDPRSQQLHPLPPPALALSRPRASSAGPHAYPSTPALLLTAQSAPGADVIAAPSTPTPLLSPSG